MLSEVNRSVPVSSAESDPYNASANSTYPTDHRSVSANPDYLTESRNTPTNPAAAPPIDSLAVTAHELKAPLTLLRQLALSLELAETPTQVAQIRQKMVHVSDRALKQIQDLAKISRLEDGLFELEPVAIRAVCDDVTAELSQLFSAQHRSLAIRYTNKSRLVTAHRDLLFSVIYNFCLNALHYSTPATQSLLTVRDSRSEVLVNIRDYGPALPRKIWQELRTGHFDRPQTIAMRPGSSGLGLYIAAQFSRHMRATIGATRHRDGTSFFVRLPISAQATLF